MKFNLNDNLNLKVKDTRKAQNTYGSGLMVHGSSLGHTEITDSTEHLWLRVKG